MNLLEFRDQTLPKTRVGGLGAISTVMNSRKDWTSARLLAGYQAGDQQAADAIFNRYLERLTRLRGTRLSPRLASRTDADDVVMSAWRSFFLGARAGNFSLLRSGDLWRLLVSITLHKLYRQVRHHSAEMRAVQSERPLNPVDDELHLLDHREPTPEECFALSDELEFALRSIRSFCAACGRVTSAGRDARQDRTRYRARRENRSSHVSSHSTALK